MPSLPLMAWFAAHDWRVDYIGSRTGPEAGLIGTHGYRFHAIAAGKLRRYASIQNVIDVFRVLKGIGQSFALLGRLRPAVVFSKGGFVSFPVVVAAWLRRVPIVAHESDLTPGLANRLTLPFVTALCTTFAATRISRRGRTVVHTGTPVRAELLQGDAERGRAWLGAPGGMPVLLVVGGSLGANAINDALRSALPSLSEYFVVHVCGPGRRVAGGDRPGHYRQFEFVGPEWGDVLAAADVVLSRAGANSLYELVALRKPHVLIPLSRKASRGDQIENADMARRLGWSHVLDEAALSGPALATTLAAAAADRTAVACMAAAALGDGTSALAAVIERYARRVPDPAVGK
jgi:UDP-N-acetylglucosamine--N-acetylmuramyl-(pentapeptide) pyrophosphoryl-undecaprenol N-acetylglucosamine transferase